MRDFYWMGVDLLKLYSGLYSKDYYVVTLRKYTFLKQVNMQARDRPRFFDQVGHQTINATIGNKHLPEL